MTSTVDSAQRGTLEPRALRRVVAALCLTEIVSYGILYYAFTVLNASIVSDTGWPLVVTTLAFSIGQVVGAVGGIAVGRIIDRHGPRAVMTAGSTLAVPALVLIALAPTSVWFVAAWSLAGVAMSAVFYTPAFSAITHWGGARALSGLTTVTLVAGFASTVFGPLSAQLDETIGWRGTFLVLAGVFAVLTIPTHWFGLRGEWIPSPHPIDADGPASATAPGREFVILAVALSLAPSPSTAPSCSSCPSWSRAASTRPKQRSSSGSVALVRSWEGCSIEAWPPPRRLSPERSRYCCWSASRPLSSRSSLHTCGCS